MKNNRKTAKKPMKTVVYKFDWKFARKETACNPKQFGKMGKRNHQLAFHYHPEMKGEGFWVGKDCIYALTKSAWDIMKFSTIAHLGWELMMEDKQEEAELVREIKATERELKKATGKREITKLTKALKAMKHDQKNSAGRK